MKRRPFLKALAGIISVPALGMLPSPAPAAPFIPVWPPSIWPNPIVRIDGRVWKDGDGVPFCDVALTHADGSVKRHNLKVINGEAMLRAIDG